VSETRKKSATEKAWSQFRKTICGKADCVVVFRLRQRDDGTWETDFVGRHWIEGVPEGKLPPGVPGAITLALGSDAVSRKIGGRAGNLAGEFLDEAAGTLMDNLRRRRGSQ
jgi:hypothetical protein